ncbi:hypothetical protein DDB_G0284541 [Dictyostelium discoideum AX4]|uniref:Uncharacterized protein n=1 Tax=Dictyostelium discoideum TaxID=44689 RepID=Q54PL4_DICDI|nr:hypothetical protein DDB_G0284541 [Dictyostelium discoideum AX4]EAL65197.1 hypothetical protein DDB_G0284541 [Dictyostelium discoideum AX4]|eukprot:XP_638518.1 hypothetical protein DDB_G0284541 [Dictyostelium discoideum AX4]
MVNLILLIYLINVELIKKLNTFEIYINKHIDCVVIHKGCKLEYFYEFYENFRGFFKVFYYNRNIIITSIPGIARFTAGLWFNTATLGARDPINGSWNGFAFNRSVSIQYPTAAISFGTRASTIRNENKVLNLTGNQSQLSGSTSTNNKQQANLIPNNPPFFITIPSAILLSGVEPIKIDPQPQNFVFDLFLLKNRIDILPNFFQSGHNIYIEPN